MFPTTDTRRPQEVEQETTSIWHQLYGAVQAGRVARAFGWVADCFAGRYDDYQPIDTRYHDLEHTLQGTLCFVHLLRGRHLAGAQPPVDQNWFELGLLAILFHDTGYLKHRQDRSGTGAKYTLVHVGRSARFARDFLRRHHFEEPETAAIENMIRCTGIDVDLSIIPFGSALERIVGSALGTADLLGQMAAPDYVDKLPALYQEFAEAADYSPEARSRLGTFASAEDLIRKTPDFWTRCVRPRLETDFGGVYAYLNDPYPDGPNAYLKCIEANMGRIEQTLRASNAPGGERSGEGRAGGG